MNQIATIERPRSVLVDMATRYGMEPAAFEATVRATVTPATTSREEFAAFLLVAKEYNLNPLTKEIYAFPKRGGGIVPIVSVDGWTSLVNSHGACDGFEFEMEHDADGELVSCTCRMYRKDRSRPVVVTEYLSECIRSTEPWKMRHRMLRHKSMIQAARYAFGFSGIYDEDEGVRVAEARDASPARAVAPPPPPPPPPASISAPKAPAEAAETPSQEIARTSPMRPLEPVDNDMTAYFESLEAAMAEAATADDVEAVWEAEDVDLRCADEGDLHIATLIKARRLAAIGGERR